MRKFLSSLVLAGAAVVALNAQDKKADEKPGEKKAIEAKKIVAPEGDEKKAAPRKQVEVTLKVGDAPPVLKADKWMQGTEVKSFEKGKVYIVEFWATWCGPCIVMMPHMSELQAEYKDKGLTIIGYTKQDPNNSEAKVADFVKKRGPKLGYTFAYSDEPDVYEAWMRAAGQNGIPCCFVVDKETKIAYIGHPMYLDVVLPKVMGGKWTEADREKVAVAEKDVNAVFASFRNPDTDAALKGLAEFETKYPELRKIPYFVGPKLSLLLKAKKFDDLKVAAKNLISQGKKSQDDSLLGQVANALRGPDAKDQKELLQISVQASEEALKVAGDKDMRALLGVSQSYLAVGEKSKGKEYGLKAFEHAEGNMKMSVGASVLPLLLEAGDKKAALEMGEQIVNAVPAGFKPNAQAQVVGMLLKGKEKAAAAELAKKALDGAIENQKPSIQLILASAYIRSGDKETGADYAKKALEAAPDNLKPGMNSSLAQAYYEIGDKPTARSYATKAVENATGVMKANLSRMLKPILDDPDGKSRDM